MSSEASEAIDTPAGIRHRIVAALDAMPAFEGGPDMTPHLQWHLDQLMGQVPPERLTASELASLTVILASAHARILAEGATQPVAKRRASRLSLVR